MSKVIVMREAVYRELNELRKLGMCTDDDIVKAMLIYDEGSYGCISCSELCDLLLMCARIK